MRIPFIILFLNFYPVEAIARCKPFDLIASIESVSYVVFGQVTQSNGDKLAASDCHPETCVHRFSIIVIQVLKGATEHNELTVDYKFIHQLPGIDLFFDDDEYVFAIENVTPEGGATLMGNNCGRSGLSSEHIESVMQALR